MTNDVLKLNAIIDDIGHKVAELVELGRDGFNVPLVTTPDELAEMVGLPMGDWRPLSNNLLWFYALKTTVYARQMLEEAARIFEQMDDEKSTQKAQNIIATFDEQFHPCETAFQVYSRLLHRPSSSRTNAESPRR